MHPAQYIAIKKYFAALYLSKSYSALNRGYVSGWFQRLDIKRNKKFR